jgi:type IV secretory pathway VirD2 relaxase
MNEFTDYKTADLYDEILEDVHSRKAQVVKEAGGWNEYLKYLEALRPQIEKDGWVFADMENVRKQNLQRHLHKMLEGIHETPAILNSNKD